MPDVAKDDWCLLKEAFAGKAPNNTFTFTNANVISYFVVRTAVDGMPADGMKAIISRAINIFQSGHIQHIKALSAEYLFIQADCMPEMRKDCMYKLLLCLDLNTSDIVSGECGCPAGKIPCASCKHIGALCYALEEFSRLGKVPEILTCIEKLQEWNRPRPKKLAIIPVADLAARMSDILLREGKGSSLSMFDPRQPHQRTLDTTAVETLCCDLLSLNQPCAFLDILVPSLDKITHDHTYSLLSGDKEVEMTSELAEPSESDVLHCTTSDKLKAVCAKIKSTLNVSSVERERIERDTRKQCRSMNGP